MFRVFPGQFYCMRGPSMVELQGMTLPTVGLAGLTRESVWLVQALLGMENKTH